MRRCIGLVVALGIVFSAITVPVSAGTLIFGSWQITVKVCTNGFTVTATGGTTAGVTTSVKAIQAELLLPNDNPPFIQLSKTLTFTSATNSLLIASSSNPKVQVIGTGHFYFDTPVHVGASVRVSFGVYSDNMLMTLPADPDIIDSAGNCTVPPPPVQVNDLSGVIIDAQVVGNALWGDGRAYPAPTDRVIIYCLSKGPFAGFIVVNGVNPTVGGNPIRLGQFSYNEVWSVRPKGISEPAVNNRGELSLSIDSNGRYVLEWTHGWWAPYVVKAFICNVDKSYYNRTAAQLLYPDAFGNDGRVAPYPTDKVIVYCRLDKRIIDVWGADFQSRGYPLSSFNYADVVAAIPEPLIHNVPGQGSVSLQVNYDDDFFLKWTGGPWKDDQIKAFKCRF